MRTEDWQLNKEPSKFSSNSKVQSYNTIGSHGYPTCTLTETFTSCWQDWSFTTRRLILLWLNFGNRSLFFKTEVVLMWVDLVGMAACTWCLCPLSKGRPQLFLFLPVWQEVSCLFWQEVWELICAELTALITWVLEDHLGEIKVFEKTSLLHLVFILSLQVQVPKKKIKATDVG